METLMTATRAYAVIKRNYGSEIAKRFEERYKDPQQKIPFSEIIKTRDEIVESMKIKPLVPKFGRTTTEGMAEFKGFQV